MQQSSEEMSDQAFTVRASYLEVGQEEIRDLLNYEAVSYRLDVQYDQQVSITGPCAVGLAVVWGDWCSTRGAGQSVLCSSV